MLSYDVNMDDPLDLTELAGETLGAMCIEARRRSGRNLREIAEAANISHVTLLSWERRSDLRLVEFWRSRGFRFSDNPVMTRVFRVGKNRLLPLGHPIVDHGAVAEWSGMKFKRTDNAVLEEHEYSVNEAVGTYRFSQKLHGRRSVIVSYKLIEKIAHP